MPSVPREMRDPRSRKSLKESNDRRQESGKRRRSESRSSGAYAAPHGGLPTTASNETGGKEARSASPQHRCVLSTSGRAPVSIQSASTAKRTAIGSRSMPKRDLSA